MGDSQFDLWSFVPESEDVKFNYFSPHRFSLDLNLLPRMSPESLISYKAELGVYHPDGYCSTGCVACEVLDVRKVTDLPDVVEPLVLKSCARCLNFCGSDKFDEAEESLIREDEKIQDSLWMQRGERDLAMAEEMVKDVEQATYNEEKAAMEWELSHIFRERSDGIYQGGSQSTLPIKSQFYSFLQCTPRSK